jgi:hypothetical protein
MFQAFSVTIGPVHVKEKAAFSLGWLSGWAYRKSHVVNSASGAGQDYQVGMKVYYGSGVDGTETVDGVIFGKVYLNGHCRSDFGDVRFTAFGGTSQLYCWTEEKVDSDYALLWAKIADDLSASPVTIYVYYGKSDAATTKDITNTFIFGDDFETDLTKWTIPNGTAELSTDHVYESAKSVKVWTGNSHMYVLPSTMSNLAVHVRYYDLVSVKKEKHEFGTDGAMSGTEFDVLVDEDHSVNNYVQRIGSTYYDTGIARTVGWHSFIIRHDGSVKSALVDGTLLPQTQATAASTSVVLGSWWTANQEYGYYDACFVRKYVSPEPAHGSWGSEEGRIASVSRIPITPNYDEDVVVTAIIIALDQAWLSYTDGITWYNLSMNKFDTTFNATIPAQRYGTAVQYKIYANDTSGNWDESSTYSYTVGDSVAPEIIAVQWKPTCPYPYVPSNITRTNEPTSITANVTEPINASGMAKVLLSYRVDSGAWWNTSMIFNSTTTLWTVTIPGQSNDTNIVEFFVQAYDVAGNLNISTTYSYQIEHLPIGDINGDGMSELTTSSH